MSYLLMGNMLNSTSGNVANDCIATGLVSSFQFENQRHSENPIPDNLCELLTSRQTFSLKKIECFGWHLAFVRRLRRLRPYVVVARGNEYAVLEQDGTLDFEAAIALRQS